jgi:excisionase family DNA binding protein
MRGPELLTVKETAAYLRIPVPTVYYLVQRGQLPAVQIGGRWRIRKELIDRDVLNLSKPKSVATEEMGKAKILVVDDEDLVQDLMRDILGRHGYQADQARTGKEGMDLVQKNKYDLMFLDIKLPDVDGDKIYEKVVEAQPSLHVIIITGLADAQIFDKILTLGPVTVLRKPLKVEQVLRLTDLLLGSFPSESPAKAGVSSD